MSNKIAKKEKARMMAQMADQARVTNFKKPQMLVGAPFEASVRVVHIDREEYEVLFNASCKLLGEPHIVGDDESRFLVDGIWMGSRYEWGMASQPKVGHALIYAKEADWLAVKAASGWTE